MSFYVVYFFVVGWTLVSLSFLVEFDSSLDVVETGSITVHVHEHLVSLLELGVLMLHELDLSHA